MHTPSISVSITVYNLEKYVEACIVSILEQEFTDFELIIIDDGSTDNSSTICKYYEQMDERIIYIYQTNQGVSAARNRAIEVSKGAYLLLADGDDQLDRTMLRKLYELAETNSADVSTCLQIAVNDRQPLPDPSAYSGGFLIMNNEEALIRLYSGKLTGYGLCNKLYKRKLFKNVRFPIGRSFEDAAVQYRLLRQANKIVFLEEQLYFYVIHAESLTRKKMTRYSDKRLDIIINFEETIAYLEQKNTSKLVLDRVAADYFKSLRWLAIDIMKENKHIRKRALKLVTEQVILRKQVFLNNHCLSKKEIYLLQLWSRLPRLTLAVYRFRNKMAMQD